MSATDRSSSWAGIPMKPSMVRRTPVNSPLYPRGMVCLRSENRILTRRFEWLRRGSAMATGQQRCALALGGEDASSPSNHLWAVEIRSTHTPSLD
jgi:hypothetical protein